MPLNYEKIKNWPIPDSVQSYTERDTILYALGVGAAEIKSGRNVCGRRVYCGQQNTIDCRF